MILCLSQLNMFFFFFFFFLFPVKISYKRRAFPLGTQVTWFQWHLGQIIQRQGQEVLTTGDCAAVTVSWWQEHKQSISHASSFHYYMSLFSHLPQQHSQALCSSRAEEFHPRSAAKIRARKPLFCRVMQATPLPEQDTLAHWQLGSSSGYKTRLCFSSPCIWFE